MRLKKELEELKHQIFADHDQRFIESVVESGKLNNVPKVGDIAPNFTLPDQFGNDINLSDILKNGPVVVSFYQGNWCPYCGLELKALQRSLADFQKLGASLVGISPDTITYIQNSDEIKQYSYSILSDHGSGILTIYGLRFDMPDEAVTALKGFGINIKDAQGESEDDAYNLPVPATFVVNTNGEMVYAFVDADFTKRAEPSEIIACLMSVVQ
ncbi:MAG: AhpC/TSA family protein [Cytophagales bacterium]|nr:AhpC/TSA family protein [Cytophagales bacterium]